MHPGVLLLYCTAMWPYYIAIASVFAAALFMRMEAQQRGGAAKEAAATRKTTAAAPPKEEVDEAGPSERAHQGARAERVRLPHRPRQGPRHWGLMHSNYDVGIAFEFS